MNLVDLKYGNISDAVLALGDLIFENTEACKDGKWTRNRAALAKRHLKKLGKYIQITNGEYEYLCTRLEMPLGEIRA